MRDRVARKLRGQSEREILDGLSGEHGRLRAVIWILLMHHRHLSKWQILLAAAAEAERLA